MVAWCGVVWRGNTLSCFRYLLVYHCLILIHSVTIGGSLTFIYGLVGIETLYTCTRYEAFGYLETSSELSHEQIRPHS